MGPAPFLVGGCAARPGASQFTIVDSPDSYQDITARRAALRKVSRAGRHVACRTATTRSRHKSRESDPPTRPSCIHRAEATTPLKKPDQPVHKIHSEEPSNPQKARDSKPTFQTQGTAHSLHSVVRGMHQRPVCRHKLRPPLKRHTVTSIRA